MIRSDPAECAMESRIAHEWDILGTVLFILLSYCKLIFLLSLFLYVYSTLSISIYHIFYPFTTYLFICLSSESPVNPSLCLLPVCDGSSALAQLSCYVSLCPSMQELMQTVISNKNKNSYSVLFVSSCTSGDSLLIKKLFISSSSQVTV